MLSKRLCETGLVDDNDNDNGDDDEEGVDGGASWLKEKKRLAETTFELCCPKSTHRIRTTMANWNEEKFIFYWASNKSLHR